MQSTSIKKIYSNFNNIITGKKSKELLIENIGNTIKHLIFYKPYKLISATLCNQWTELEDKKKVILAIQVKRHYPAYKISNIPYRITVLFDNKTINLVFFSKFTGYLKELYKIDSITYISGTLAIYGNKFQIMHPIIVNREDIDLDKKAIITLFYRQKSGLKSKIIHRSILKILPFVPRLNEWHISFFDKYPCSPSWNEAINNLHSGKDEKILDDKSISMLRLAYDEILANQLSLTIIRKSINNEKSNKYKPDSKKIINNFKKLLDYKLTNDQDFNTSEVISDLNSSSKMLRLLHGDVGSGKTVVAIMSALHVINSGYQVAILVPTEILANQHFDFVNDKLIKLKYKTCLLTASTNNKNLIKTKLANGECDLIIGTHSLLQDSIKFKNLSYVIIDEQHRFGVGQRLNIRNKGNKVDMLLLSATPIPRTMLLATLGDIKTSTIKKRPYKNKIKTILKSDKNITEVIKFIKNKIYQSKVFWICPLIEDSDEKNNNSSVEKRYKVLKRAFKNVGFLHGKLNIDEKNKVLEDFKVGKIMLLISTVVIEVGIDIPDANIILIDHADRFGLAQIHQLRGRVGRGNKDAICILLYKDPLTEIAKERLKTIKESSNGFELAERDLMMRGGGEILGKNQYGFENFIFFDISIHKFLIDMASKEAEKIINEDPCLEKKRGKALIELLYLFKKDKAVDLISAG